jgi:hypothetical protein
MAAKKNGSKTAIRGMLLELNESDRDLLDKLVGRYGHLVQSPNKAFVIRQLIRNASEAAKLPPLKLP